MNPHLHVVDPETGELVNPGCKACHEHTARIAGLENDCEVLHAELTRTLRQIQAFKRDREKERLGDPQRDQIVAVFDYWREKCGHPNARFDGKRFDLIKNRLKQFTADELKLAIDGAAVDSYVDPKGKRHDRLGLIFESAERVEDFANRYARWCKRTRHES